MQSAHDVTRAFEAELCRYTGAKYAVTTTSCTMALQLAFAWVKVNEGRQIVSLPRNTYVGVASAALNAGHKVKFEHVAWEQDYVILVGRNEIYDRAWSLEEDSFIAGAFECLSFHWTKPLGLSQGGAILHDNDAADDWLRRARFDGRKEGVPVHRDTIQYPSWHAYLSPEVAAQGLMKLQARAFREPRVASWADYPDISTQECWR